MKRFLAAAFGLLVAFTLTGSSAWAFPSTSGWTQVHEALYNWMGDDPNTPEVEGWGTLVTQSVPNPASWTVGDVSGITWTEVLEKTWVDPLDSSHAVFEWTVQADYHPDDYWISSIHIPNWGFLASDAKDSVDVFPGFVDAWNFSQTASEYAWILDTANYPCETYGIDGSTVTFSVELFNYLDYGITNWAYADYCNAHTTYHDGEFWVVSHPVPEPASMLLLGSGLVGLAGFGRRLRKR